tara:strand:- start:1762 stop:4107 length:2346 start_codon:yes stop_codon:yes gene_type:complete
MSLSKPDHDHVATNGQACMLDSAGKIVWTNDAWRHNGSPLPIPLDVGDNYHTACQGVRTAIADASKLVAALENLLSSNAEHFSLEVCWHPKDASAPTRDNTPGHCLIRAHAITIDGSRRFMICHEDVSEARTATAALYASEERYRQFFEASPDAVFLLSSSPEDTGRILDANTNAAVIHGYTRDELLTMSIADLDVGEDAELVKQRIASLFAKGSIAFTATHRRRDGSQFPVEVTARTVTVGGQPCIISFHRDTSERREFEHAMRENKMRIDLAARASRVGFWHWDLHDNTVIFSPEWKAQIGYAPDEIEDDFEEWRNRVHPDDLERAMLAVNNHISGKADDYVTEFRFRHRDGSYRWIYVRGEVARDATGQPLRFVGCHVDITATKQAEEERELMTQRLNQLQRIEAMGTLAGGIAHDFNNILGIISGNVELALATTEDPSLTESLTEIHKAGLRASSLVRQILSFSREEAPERKTVKLSAIVEEAARLLRSSTPQHIKIDSTIETKGAIAFADPEQLHQALVNLGTNACHAIGDGSGHVNLRLTSGPIPEHLTTAPIVPTDADCAILEISDDGEGMSEELQSRIFEPFFTTKTTGQGTGLGLSVVHGIVAAHGGAIDLESKLGTGTTFRIFLPPSTVGDQAPPPSRAKPSGAGVHVLLVDDEPNLLRVLTRGLQRYDFEITSLTDPKAAVAAIKEAPDRFAVFITDFDMPGLNGIESTRIIREICPDLPILLCSGFMDNKTSTEASEAGVTRLMTKPISVRHLAQTICELHGASSDRHA